MTTKRIPTPTREALKSAGLLVVCSAFAIGCGGSPSDDEKDPASGGSGGGAGTGTGTGGSGATGSGGSSSGGSSAGGSSAGGSGATGSGGGSGAGGSPNPGDNWFELVQPDFTVEPADEWTWCYRLPIPAEHHQPGSMYVTGFESFLSPGTHHYFAYYNGDPRPETKVSEPTPCFDDGPRGQVVDSRADKYKDGQGMTFGAPEGNGSYFLKPGYAYELASTDGYFLTDHHVFNTTDQTLTVAGRMKYFYAAPETITHVLNMMTCTIAYVQVNPYSEARVTGTCKATQPMDLIVLASHAHMYLTKFTQYRFDGTQTLPDPIYESDDWDSPKIQVLDEPVHLEPGEGITVQCDYTNGTSNLVLPGVGEAGEMCVGMNLFVRSGNTRDTPAMGGLVLFSGGTADITEGGTCGPFGAVTCRN